MLSRFLMSLPIPDDYIQAFHWFFFWFNVSDIGQTFGGDAFSPWEYHPVVFARCLRQWKCCPAMPTTTAVRTVWTLFVVAREQHGRVWNWGTPYPPSTKQVRKLMIFQDLPVFRPQMELAVQVPSGTGWPRQIIHSWERIRRKTWTSQASLRRVFVDLKFTSLAPQDSTRLSRFVSSFSMMCQHDHPRAAENIHPKMKLSIELSTHPNSGWKDTILQSWLCPNWWIYVYLEYQHHIASPSCWGLTWLCLKKMCPECPESTGRIIILLEYMEVS